MPFTINPELFDNNVFEIRSNSSNEVVIENSESGNTITIEEDGTLSVSNLAADTASVSSAPSSSSDVARKNEVDAVSGNLTDHESNTSNPHNVTTDQIGAAELDGSGVLKSAQVPDLSITETYTVADQTERLALAAEEGDIALQTDNSTTYIFTGGDPSNDADWSEFNTPPPPVDSVFGRTGAVVAESGDYSYSQISGTHGNADHSTDYLAASNRYTDSEAISAINNDTDHGSTASHNYFSGDHADLTNVTPGQHHTRYSDSEAVSAVEGASSLTLSGGLDLNGNSLADAGTTVWDSTNGYVPATSLEAHDNTAHSLEFVSDGDGTTRQVWVIANGAAIPPGAASDDIIFELQ